MIIEVRVANYRSIADEQSLTFLASPDRTHEKSHCVKTHWPSVPRLLRSAVLVGPNASGKTNLLSAIRTLRDLVVSSNQSGAGLELHYHPFYPKAKATPTIFQIDLLIERVRFRYHLSYNGNRVLREELRVNFNHKSQRWFARYFDEATQTECWEPFSSAVHGPREAWRQATGPSSLFLSMAAKLNAGQLAPLMHWFEEQLNITLQPNNGDCEGLASHLANPRFKQRALEIIRKAGFAVRDMRVKERHVASRRGSATGVELLCERYESSPIWLAAEEYSSGARQLVNLFVPLLDGMENDRFVVIDEFDTHLHPLVAKLLLQMVNDPIETGRRVQVLLVSQTTALLDLSILRRDELWLMHIDERESSALRSLRAFSPRRHENIERAYLKGRYGALPQMPRH